MLLNGFTGGRAPNVLDPWGLGPRTLAGTDSTPTLASTSQAAGTGRCRYTATTTAGRRSSGASQYWRGNAATRGGFRIDTGFVLGANSTSSRLFVGLAGVDSFLVDGGNPGSQGSVPMVGVGFDDSSGTGDNLRIFHCDAGGSVTSVDTGLVRSTGQVTHVRIFSDSNASSISVEIQRRENTGSLSSATYTLSSNIPSSTALLYLQLSVRGNGAASSGQLDVAYCEARSFAVIGSASFDPAYVYQGWFGRGEDAGDTTQYGLSAVVGSGTTSVGTLSTTTYLTSLPRARRTTTSTTNTAGWRQSTQGRVWRGDSAGEGGFDVTLEYGFETHVLGTRGFAGLYDQNAAFLTDDGDPGSLASRAYIGIGWDVGTGASANMFLAHNDALAGVTTVDTGISRSVGSVLRLRLECTPNESAVRVTFDDLTRNLNYTTSVSSNMPAQATFLSPQVCLRGATSEIACLLGGWHRRVI